MGVCVSNRQNQRTSRKTARSIAAHTVKGKLGENRLRDVRIDASVLHGRRPLSDFRQINRLSDKSITQNRNFCKDFFQKNYEIAYFPKYFP